MGIFGVRSSLTEMIYVLLITMTTDLMSMVQRLFNDFSQISVVGVSEIIALG